MKHIANDNSADASDRGRQNSRLTFNSLYLTVSVLLFAFIFVAIITKIRHDDHLQNVNTIAKSVTTAVADEASSFLVEK